MAMVLQVAGSVILLMIYCLIMSDHVKAQEYRFIIPNIVGGSLLVVSAIMEGQIGFLILNGAWTIIAIISLVRKIYKATRPE